MGNGTGSNLSTALLRVLDGLTARRSTTAQSANQKLTSLLLTHFMEDGEGDPTRLFWYFIVRSKLNYPKAGISTTLKFASLVVFCDA